MRRRRAIPASGRDIDLGGLAELLFMTISDSELMKQAKGGDRTALADLLVRQEEGDAQPARRFDSRQVVIHDVRR